MQIWLKKIDVGRPRKKGCNQGAQAAAAHGHGGTVHAARELENDEVAHGAAGQKLVPVRAPERAEVTCTMLEVGMLINAGSSTRCCRAGSKNNSLGIRRTDFRVRSVPGTLAFTRAMLHSMPLSRSRAAFTWLGLATRTILLSTWRREARTEAV